MMVDVDPYHASPVSRRSGVSPDRHGANLAGKMPALRENERA